MLLRDCNLKVGSSVRAIAECAAEGTTDLTIIITMSESRLLSRAPKLFAKNEGSYLARTVSPLVSVWRFKNGDWHYVFLQVC